MKLFYTLLMLVFFHTCATAQTQVVDTEMALYVNKIPEPGFKIDKYIKKNVIYPSDALEAGIEGKVVIVLIVNAKGKVSVKKILKSVSPSLDSEAVRLVNAMPNWHPAFLNGHDVGCYYSLPIDFILPKK